jgi:2,4-didehydro-3-deoxy-L-rhamnonate hydrolase
MRLCRFIVQGQSRWGLYTPERVVAVDRWVAEQTGMAAEAGWEACLPLDSPQWAALVALLSASDIATRPLVETFPVASIQLLPPVGRPPKLLLLAGNYAEHVREQGDLAAEKRNTFPYVFMKPPSTTLVGSGTPVAIPACSPNKIDHEVELGVVIGRRIRNVAAQDALSAVAGYTVINDLSDRGFRPNPGRQTRPRDTFFDWMHGKWHDGFCPCGPCLVTADELPYPQQLELKLVVDGETRQHGSTSQMVFSVAEVIEFISSFMTLEPGDILSTGTPAGVGNATGKYLAAGQHMVASVDVIGAVHTPLIGATAD